MELHENPLLKPEDYNLGYKENIEKLKNNPHLVELDKLCYEVFNTEHGKKFLEVIEDRFLSRSMVSRDSPNYAMMLIWADGFKDAFRMISDYIKKHEQRIQAETNK